MPTNRTFSMTNLPRCRWNVVDLVTIVGREAVRAYMFFDVDMSWAQQLRDRFTREGESVTFTAILLKSIAIAQRAYPQTLQGYLPFNLRVNFHDVAAGFTVEKPVGSQPAVFFGVIDEPEKKSLVEIAAELRDYATGNIEDIARLKMEHSFANLPPIVRRAVFRLGMLWPPLRLTVNHATFGLSTLGKYGVVAALGPCVCACTFGIGAVEDRPVVRDGQVVVRPIMTMALSYDMRLVDSGPAARFMRDIKDLIEGGLEEYRLVKPLATAQRPQHRQPLRAEAELLAAT